jgi:predicted nucleic acid-binding protein
VRCSAPSRTSRGGSLAEVLRLRPLPIDRAVADAWALLRLALRDAERRMPVNDSWIAATAMALGAPLVTQDHDHVEVDGLTVLHV